MSQPYLIFSKSRSEAFWECPRKEYLGYLWGGYGLKPLASALELEYGGILHDAAAELCKPHLVGRPATDTYLEAPLVFTEANQRVRTLGKKLKLPERATHEWAVIMEGWLRAYHRHVLPSLLREYEIVGIEVPCVLPVAPEIGAWFVSKPDLILRSRYTGGLWVWERKSTGSVEARWINSWTKAVQVHTEVKAAEAKFGQPFDGAYVEGWYKGRKDTYGPEPKQVSPFSYGWMAPGAAGITPDRYDYKKPKLWKGWEQFPTWSLIEGLGPWIANMPQEVLLEQFVRTPPITVREDLVAQYLRQLRTHAFQIREFQQQAAAAVTDHDAVVLLDAFFPQAFNKCEPSWGRYNCAFGELCWSSATGSDPLASGLYQKNTGDAPHRVEFVKLIDQQGKVVA